MGTHLLTLPRWGTLSLGYPQAALPQPPGQTSHGMLSTLGPHEVGGPVARDPSSPTSRAFPEAETPPDGQGPLDKHSPLEPQPGGRASLLIRHLLWAQPLPSTMVPPVVAAGSAGTLP